MPVKKSEETPVSNSNVNTNTNNVNVNVKLERKAPRASGKSAKKTNWLSRAIVVAVITVLTYYFIAVFDGGQGKPGVNGNTAPPISGERTD